MGARSTASEYRAAVEKGALFAVTVNGELEAISGIFDSGAPTHGEVGGTFVAESIRGFRLQRILFRVRFGAAVVGLEKGVRLVTGIKSTNTDSLKNMSQEPAGKTEGPEQHRIGLGLLSNVAGVLARHPSRPSARSVSFPPHSFGDAQAAHGC